jgi:hypothetical protein
MDGARGSGGSPIEKRDPVQQGWDTGELSGRTFSWPLCPSCPRQQKLALSAEQVLATWRRTIPDRGRAYAKDLGQR